MTKGASYAASMPELPEVENVRRTLLPRLVGARVAGVRVRRGDVVRWCGGERSEGALGAGRRIVEVRRHGKQLALLSEPGRPDPASGVAVCVHLGMTGALVWAEPRVGDTVAEVATPGAAALAESVHDHVVWWFEGGGKLTFRDTRRFGGVWCYDDFDALRAARWAGLGPDALRLTPGAVRRGLAASRVPVKAALLDQSRIAGLGNIYVDELLFNVGLHPLTPAGDVATDRPLCEALARRTRSLLQRAVEAGGSSIRDYVDGEGRAGGFQRRHRVYGRGGLRCVRRRCRAMLMTGTIAGRTTVWCPACQAWSG